MWWEWVGLLIHVVFLKSIFDIYSTPKIVKDLNAECAVEEPPAKRLVFMVTSGTRADVLFRGSPPIPGAWGVAVGYPPAKSVPGMAALTAGLHVDPIFTDDDRQYCGTKWDTFLNRSKKVFYIGCSSTMRYFESTETISKWSVCINPMCNDEYKRFEDTSSMDDYVVEKLNNIFKESLYNENLYNELNQNQTVIFLQFQSVETAGTLNGPHSEVAMYAVKELWDDIEFVLNITEKYYGDSSTAFILASDKGLTNLGAYGGNSADERETPISFWGAGVAKWGKRHILKQVDVPSLAASLIGVPVPVHNLGIIPGRILSTNEHWNTKALVCNAFQLGSLSSAMTSKLPRLWYAITGNEKVNFSSYKYKILEEFEKRNYSGSQELCKNLMSMALVDFTYVESFFRSFIMACFFILSAGWFLLLVTIMLPDESGQMREYSWYRIKRNLLDKKTATKNLIHSFKKASDNKEEEKTKEASTEGEEMTQEPNKESLELKSVKVEVETRRDSMFWRFYRFGYNAILPLFIVGSVFLYFKYGWPTYYLLYMILPVAVWWSVLSRVERFVNFYNLELKFNWKAYLIYGAVGFISSEYLVWAMQKKVHIAFSIAVLGFLPLYLKKKSWFHIVGFFFFTSALSAITLYPKHEVTINPWVIHTTQVAGIIVTFVFVKLVRVPYRDLWLTLSLICLQTIAECCLFANDLIINASSLKRNDNFYKKIPTPTYMKIICWSLLTFGWLLPAAPYKKRLTVKLFQVIIGLSITIILTTISSETLGLLVLSLYLVFWFLLEKSTNGNLVDFKSFSRADARRAIILLFFLCFSHLIVGDYSATEDGFDRRLSRCFMDFENNRLLAVMIFLRLLALSIIPIAFFFRVCSFSGVEVEKVFPLTIILNNIMAMRIFFETTDEILKMDKNNAIIRNCIFHIHILSNLAAFLLCRYFYRLSDSI